MSSQIYRPFHLYTPLIIVLWLTSEHQNRVDFRPFVFHAECDIFCLIYSFMFRFFLKWISCYEQNFEYSLHMKKICFSKNLGRVIRTHPLKIDFKTSIANKFLPVTFLHKMRYLFSNWFVFDSVFCKISFKLLPNFWLYFWHKTDLFH